MYSVFKAKSTSSKKLVKTKILHWSILIPVFKMKSTLILVGTLACLGVSCAQMCFPDEYTCANDNCVPETSFCDGNDDCGDGSDEPDGCTACPVGYWQCENGYCIPENYICDGDNDCGDESDETGDCPPCPGGRWQCPNGNCIYEEYICDGDNDCGDWSDETEEQCPCGDNEVRCASTPGDGPPGACIPPEYVCDPEGIWDCSDGSDEANCTTRAASTNKFHRVKVTSLRSKKAALKNTLKAKKAKGKLMDSRKKLANRSIKRNKNIIKNLSSI